VVLNILHKLLQGCPLLEHATFFPLLRRVFLVGLASGLLFVADGAAHDMDDVRGHCVLIGLLLQASDRFKMLVRLTV
jgi:hypothetical protein